MIINRERVLSKEEVSGVLDRINQRQVIKCGSSMVLGMGIAKFITASSPVVDKFFFNDIGNFLTASKYGVMSIVIPNWFILLCLVGYCVALFATTKKYTKELKK